MSTCSITWTGGHFVAFGAGSRQETPHKKSRKCVTAILIGSGKLIASVCVIVPAVVFLMLIVDSNYQSATLLALERHAADSYGGLRGSANTSMVRSHYE